MIITVDGLDGSGKSTLARNLSAYYDCLFIDKPLHEFYNQVIPTSKQSIDKMYDNILKLNSSILNAYHSTLPLLYIKETGNNRKIIINGGLLTSYIQNGNDNTETLYEFLANNGLLFNLAIVLYCDREERLNRLRKKTTNDNYLMSETLSTTNYNRTFEFIKKYPNENIIIIDTTNKTVDEVLAIAKAEIDQIINKVYKKN